MKTINNVTIYKCDFCKKELKRKGAMTRHEERCGNNPENQRPCWGCVHRADKELEYETGVDDYRTGEPVTRKAKGSFCKAKGIMILPVHASFLKGAERLYNVKVDGVDTEQFDMPKECDKYEFGYSEFED